MLKKIEILAPAGSYESLVAAVNAGADAIYIGGAKFGARASAKSVSESEDEILKGIAYAHHFDVKVYLTVNTLLKEEEIGELYEYILPYYEAGIDALIVQDLGVLSYLDKHFKNIDKHISTQMSLTSYEQIEELKKYGVTRVVTARELTLKEIREIYDNTGIEIESFVHGALCYAYSGQCLMSSLIGGRSGNRGRCAQTCRLEYDLFDDEGNRLNKENERSLLSCKDLSALDILPDIIEAGVYSLKIEGRMKSATYTAGVVSIWRKYVDLYLKKGRKSYIVDKRDKRLLLDLFDRGGQTLGFYTEHNSKDVIALKGKPKNRIINEEFNKYINETYVDTIKKLSLAINLELREDKEIKLKARILDDYFDKNIEVEIFYGMIEKAKTSSANIDDIKKQILKLGNTLYSIKELNIEMDDNLFVPVKLLNELRRLLVEELDIKIANLYQRNELEIKENFIKPQYVSSQKLNKKINICIEEEYQLDTILEVLKIRKNDIDNKNYLIEISYNTDTFSPNKWLDINNIIKELGFKVNLYLPHIFRTHAKKFFEKNIENLKKAKFDALIIRNLEENFYFKEVFKDENIDFIFDYTLYEMNNETDKILNSMGRKRQTLAVELNLRELKNLELSSKELIVYGHLSMMVSASCLRKNTIGCDMKESLHYLKDRLGKEFPVKNHCKFCYNTILNFAPLSSLGISREIKKLNVNTLRIMFTIEEEKEIRNILNSYIDCFIFDIDMQEENKNFTRGHFKRGIT